MSNNHQLGFELDELESAGKRLVEKLVEYYRECDQNRVAPAATREQVFKRFENTLGDQGIGLSAAVEEFDMVKRLSVSMSHSLYLGLVNSSPFPPAALGDLIVSALDNNSGASHQGPAAAAAERELMQDLSNRIGYPGDGIMLPGGSYANLHALMLAREHAFPDWSTIGPTSLTKQPKVYTVDGAHFSLIRACNTVGLGADSIVEVDVTGRGEMNVADLRRRVTADRKIGNAPFAVLSTVGTTGTGAIDSVDEIADVCRANQLWLHVDACYGGAARMLPELANLFTGIEKADSFAVDLHKWLFMPLTAGALYTRHAGMMHRVFSARASYIPDDGFVEAYMRGIPTSRRSTSLAIWFAIRACGWQVLLDAIERNIALTRMIEEKLDSVGFRVMPNGKLSIACARWEPAKLSAATLDKLQEGIATSICASGDAWFASTRFKDQNWLRINMVNLNTTERHVLQLVELVAETAIAKTAELTAES